MFGLNGIGDELDFPEWLLVILSQCFRTVLLKDFYSGMVLS